jgi:hypothetical protein
MDKTIVIGLGGTGLETIRSLRRRAVETHGSLDSLPQLGFLYIDTDPKETVITEDNRKRWEVLGVSTALSDSEFCIIDAPEVGPIVSNIGSFPHIQEWFPVDVLRSIDQSAKDTPGARQIRPLGRFAFTLKTEIVEGAFKKTYTKLPQAAGGGKTQVYVVCSLSGGTGSGMFLDMAYRIREWTAGNCETLAFLVLPELTTSRGPRYFVNAYAALLELNYFNVGTVHHRGEDRPIAFKLPRRERPVSGAPFDYCYLLSPRNEAGVEIALDTLPEMIAHRIYLNFDSSFADDAHSLLNNGSFERALILQDPFTGNRHSQNFMTFGLSSIQYPIEQITEIFAYRIGADLVSGWLKKREVPGNINERVQSYLPEFKLTDDYLLGNKDFFGRRTDYESYDREIENSVNEVKRTAPEKNIVAFVTDKQRQFTEQFRAVGLLRFFQDKRDDLAGAVQEAVKLIRAEVAAILTDPELGHEFAVRVLDEMVRIFDKKHGDFVETINGFPTREAGSRRALNAFCNELTQAEAKLVFRDKAVKQSLSKVGDALRHNLSATIGVRAYEFGRAFLSRLLEELEAMREHLVDWRNAVEKLGDELTEEIARRTNHLGEKMRNVKEFNGAILFDETTSDALYGGFDIPSAMRHVEAKWLRISEHGALSVPFAAENQVDVVYRAALDWLSNVSQVRVTDTNVADKLFADYPDPSGRRNVLSENYRKSMPFLVFDEIERQIAAGEEGVGYTYSPTTAAQIVGMLDDDGGSLKRVSELKKDVQAATGLERSDIRKISDAHQILFLHEVTAFPLRLIKELKTLKERHDQYLKSKQAIPIYIQKHFDPPLMDLFLTSEEEIRAFERAEEDYLLAWVEGKIGVEMNRKEMCNEVRYRFLDAGSNAFLRLGSDREAAFEFFLGASEEAGQVRRRLAEDIRRHLGVFDTQPKKRELARRLAAHLEELRNRCELADEDPTYQRYDGIRRRIVIKHALPHEASTQSPRGRAPDPPPVATDGADGELEEKFMTLVRTALRSGKTGLTPALRNMIRASQKRYGISDARAHELMGMVEAEFTEPDTVVEYREMFEALYEDGQITDDERALLVERQVELGLADDDVQRIEERVIRKKMATVGAAAALEGADV